MRNRDHEPFLLSEAVLTLYPQSASGEAVTSVALWAGACANELKLTELLEGLLLAGSGDRFQTEHHVDESHAIQIDRTWVVRRAGEADFKPQRGQQYVLDIVWTAGDSFWHRRTYYGVTARSYELVSSGTRHFAASQVFRGQYYSTDSGTGLSDESGALVPAAPAGEVFSAGFYREPIFYAGEYFLGNYRWAKAVLLTSAQVVAKASTGTDTVLGLEVNGTLTGDTLTLPAGAQNSEVTDETALSVAVAAGESVRWKVLSGPADEADMAWLGAVLMEGIVVE